MDYAGGRGLQPPAHRQDRQRQPRAAGAIARGLGPECLPINRSAQGGKAVVDRFPTRRRGRRGAGRGAPAHHRPGGGDQRIGDGPLPGRGRSRPIRRNCTTPSNSACAKVTWRRSAWSRHARRRGHELLQLVRAPGATEGPAIRHPSSRVPAPTPQPLPPKPIRPGTSSPTCSRSSTILRGQAQRVPCLPGHGAARHPAVHRRRQKPFRWPPVAARQGAHRSTIPGDIAAVASGRDPFRRCAARFHDENRSRAAGFPAHVSDQAVEPAHKGQEQKLTAR